MAHADVRFFFLCKVTALWSLPRPACIFPASSKGARTTKLDIAALRCVSRSARRFFFFSFCANLPFYPFVSRYKGRWTVVTACCCCPGGSCFTQRPQESTISKVKNIQLNWINRQNVKQLDIMKQISSEVSMLMPCPNHYLHSYLSYLANS